jgi:plastocyanin
MRTRLGLLLAIAMLTGCGGNDSATSGKAESAPASAPNTGEIVDVRMKDIKFEPQNVAAKVGQTIRWTNDDSVAHNVKAQSGADFSSDTLTKGKTFEAKLGKTGTINYVCTIHPGQKGTITVEG